MFLESRYEYAHTSLSTASNAFHKQFPKNDYPNNYCVTS